ncbi:MAG: EAL domain-containing protein [Ferrovibrio sp.]|uniref:EAL domain-containing protein n=1 Tax=Ferrovibrio sp. TaxID=1917215 RepID=UPI00260FEC3F|nr:EAL domain-containing protein [Ferrovibrio sp.]MCW0232481.1 EAL domain-containing protein [Ferrovibrio sp.]
MLDPNQRKLTQDILDWLDRPAFTVEYGPGDDYRYVSCNTAYAALTEMNAEALAGQGLSAGFALGEVTKVRDLLDMTRREGRRQIGNTLIRWANGWLCQGLTVAPLNDNNGHVTGLMVIAEASTPEKMHQVALQVAEYKLRDFAELASDWFWETDVDHRFTWISDSASAQTSALRAMFLGRCRWEVATQGDNEADTLFWEEHRRQLDRHEPFRSFRYCSLTDENELWIEINGKPVFDANGRFMGYRGSGRDITEQYRQQRRIEAALRQAEEANRAKSQFLANMSHELRTPLNAIIGFSEIIRDQMFGSVGVPRYVDYARDINGSGTHLLALIGDILDMSRIEAGYYALDEKAVDLSTVIQSALTMVRPQAERGGITLRNLSPEILPQLRADERVIKQVLINLLGNAVKFTPSGGTIDVVFRQLPDGTPSLTVIDTGIGITSERLEHIFEPFQLAKAEVARQHGGTGLGLSISKRLMELHGGSLALSSAVGSGTQAQMTFPNWRLLSDADQEWTPPVPLAEPSAPAPHPPPVQTRKPEPPIQRRSDSDMAETLRDLLSTMNEGMLTIDGQGHIVSATDTCAVIFGYAPGELNGQNVKVLMPEPFRSGHDSYVRNYLTTKRAKILGLGRDTLGRKKSGEIFPIHISVGEYAGEDGPAFIGLIRDISDRRDVELRAEFASRNDPLTGILNRASFIAETERMLGAQHRLDGGLWVLFNLDMDGFRDINEGFGYHIGDLVLKGIAERLGEVLPREALIGRIAADQFAALAGVNDLNNALNLAQAVHAHLTKPITADGRLVPLKVSMGAAIVDDPAEKIGDAMAKAELAMKLVRSAGGDSTRFYSPEMTRAAERRLRLTMNLDAAMENGEFHVVYQPVVETATGAICAIEALLRWKHPDLGAISPSEFIPLAEETGSIIPITRWVFATVAEQIRTWRRAGIEPRRVFVNVSGQQFIRDDLPAHFRKMAQEEPEMVSFIGIEITEQAAIQNMEATVQAIRELAEIGVDAALDDFGTGYSSLSYIQRLPIRKIKLDRAFIADLPGNDRDIALVRAMIGMANGLDLPVVAEGVETAAQRDFLRGVGCSEMQGYLISRPVPPEDMGELLRQSDRRRRN